MPDILVTVDNTASAFDVTAGELLQTPLYLTGFDHASLVSAFRSRSDGYDLRMWHQLDGRVQIATLKNENTSACTVEFNARRSILAGSADANYRIRFGDLGQTISSFETPGTPTIATPSITVGVPSVTLPSPGFPLTYTRVDDVRELAYPDYRTPHRKAAHENQVKTYELTWNPGVSAEDWYEIRAFVRSQAGGASSFTVSWLTGTYRVVPDSLVLAQDSRRSFRASLQIEEVPV